ncbi:MAG: hypothetical protein H5T86_13585, partial [Armatimonadetes bacterium]|nr:hypothetical protein [Armatimonadota bacterium]
VWYDARQELMERTGFQELPEALSNEAIGRLRLLERAESVPPREGEDPLSWALRVTLGEAWGKRRLALADLEEIVGALCDPSSPDAAVSLARTRLREFDGSNELRTICGWLAEAPRDRSRCLAATWATLDMPEDVRIQWLSQAGFQPEDVRRSQELLDAIPSASFSDAVPMDIATLRRAATADGLREQGLRFISHRRARVDKELAALRDWLMQRAQHGELLDHDEAETVLQWVKPLEYRPAADAVRALCWILQARPLPSPLPSDADWRTVSPWLDKYLKAYVSLAASGQLADTHDTVRSFEEWLIDTYHSLMLREGVGSHWFAHELGKMALEPGAAAVILVVADGLPAPLVEVLLQSLTADGEVQALSVSPFLALLPSTTRRNKPSILSGLLAEEDAARKSGFEHLFSGDFRAAAQHIDRDRVQLALPEPGTATLVHWTYPDKLLLHAPMNPVQRWTHAYVAAVNSGRCLARLCRDARSRGLQVVLGCVNDHGWTELPAGVTRVLPLPERLDSVVCHGRVVIGAELPKSDTVFVLDPMGFFLSEPATVASGYSCFAQRPPGAVHGGATPQEVAAFGFWVTNAASTEIEVPLVEIEGTIRRGVPDNPVEVRVINAGREPITVVEVAGPRIATREGGDISLPAELGSGQRVTLPAVCDARGVRGDIRLSIEVTWCHRGVRRQATVELQRPTTGAAVTDEGFEDMFDL